MFLDCKESAGKPGIYKSYCNMSMFLAYKVPAQSRSGRITGNIPEKQEFKVAGV